MRGSTPLTGGTAGLWNKSRFPHAGTEQIQEIKQELLWRNSLVSSCHILFEMNSLHDTNDGEFSLYFLPVLPENEIILIIALSYPVLSITRCWRDRGWQGGWKKVMRWRRWVCCIPASALPSLCHTLHPRYPFFFSSSLPHLRVLCLLSHPTFQLKETTFN